MSEKRRDVAGGMAKRMASVHKGGPHAEKRPKRKRFSGKDKRAALRGSW